MILVYLLTLYHTNRLLATLRKKPFENNTTKGKNASCQHFQLFPQCFIPIPKTISIGCFPTIPT